MSTELDGIHFAYEVWSIFFLLIAAILNLSPENNILGKFLEEAKQEHILNYLDFPFQFKNPSILWLLVQPDEAFQLFTVQ